MEYLSSVRPEKVFIIQDLAEQIQPIKQQSSYRKETSLFRKKGAFFFSHSSLCTAIKRALNTKRLKKKKKENKERKRKKPPPGYILSKI